MNLFLQLLQYVKRHITLLAIFILSEVEGIGQPFIFIPAEDDEVVLTSLTTNFEKRFALETGSYPSAYKRDILKIYNPHRLYVKEKLINGN